MRLADQPLVQAPTSEVGVGERAVSGEWVFLVRAAVSVLDDVAGLPRLDRLMISRPAPAVCLDWWSRGGILARYSLIEWW